MRIALAQIDVTVGDIEGNLERCLDAVASAHDADVVVLPELAITGYPPEDLLARAGFIERAEDAVQRFAARAARPAVVGFVERGAAGPHNAAAYVEGGAVSTVYRKRLLPNYGVFDEERYFEPGDTDVIVEVSGTPCALTICEDIWHPATVERLAASGARVILNLSASPFHRGKGGEREAMLRERALGNGVWVAYCNLVGGQDELVFDGRSMVFAPDGSLASRAGAFAEAIVFAEVEDRATGAPADGAVAHSPEGPEELYLALTLGLGDYCRKNGFTDVVLGLSGGIDSALVAVVAADALGAGHVHGVLMPGPYSSTGSVDDARELAAALGIDTHVVPIAGPLNALLETLEPAVGDLTRTLTEENLQARVRGTLLMALSNANGWLVLATGNKSELAVGYSTLYGDMVGGYAPVKDVFKTNVYELARWRNSVAAVIPQATIDKPPSAELRPDQTDQDTLPPYDVLDSILLGYIERDRSVADLLAEGHDAATVERVVRMVDAAEYKRRQAAPGTRVTGKAFGRDRRMPITNAYRG